ncbi:MAG: hypothetical protein ABL893_14170, partial [Hyphomicrobium sp.]
MGYPAYLQRSRYAVRNTLTAFRFFIREEHQNENNVLRILNSDYAQHIPLIYRQPTLKSDFRRSSCIQFFAFFDACGTRLRACLAQGMVILMLLAFRFAIGADVATDFCERLQARRIESCHFGKCPAHWQHGGNRTDTILERRIAFAQQLDAVVDADLTLVDAMQRRINQRLMLRRAPVAAVICHGAHVVACVRIGFICGARWRAP